MTPDRTPAAEALTSQPPPGRPPARGRQEADGDPFGTLLDQHQARTADAEGHVKESRQDSSGQKPASTVHGPHSTDKDKDADKDKPAAATPPTAQPAVIAAVPVTPVVAQAADAVSTSQVAGQVVQAAVGQQAPTPATPLAAPVELAATSTAPVVTGSAVPAQPANPPKAAQVSQVPVATQQPVVADAPQAPATPAAPKPATPATPVAANPAPVDAGKADPKAPGVQLATPTSPHATTPAPNPTPQQDSQPQQKQDTPAGVPAPAPAAAQTPAATHAQPAPQAAISNPQSTPPQAAAAQPAPPAPAPATPSTPPAPALPGARLEQAVETVHQVIRISQSNGITQARVQLHPEELGSIDIHLRSTPDGVVARVIAHAAQAAGVLRDGGDELRRQLAAQGINLSHFDVGTAGGDQREAAFGNGGSQQRGNRSASTDDAGNGAAPADDPDETTTIGLPNGVLVDVLA
jgi:flagellar hook-length control protein FliK